MNKKFGQELDADALANRLDETFPPGAHEVEYPLDSDPRVWAAWRTARGPHPVLDEETAARIEARLLVASRLSHKSPPAMDERAAITSGVRHPAHARPRAHGSRGRRWLRAAGQVAAALLVLSAALFGTVTVSADSLPGEALYPVKRLVERGQLALANDAQSLDLRLRFAERRLNEFERLLARGDVHASTLDDAAEELASALKLVQRGARPVDAVADQILSLTARQLSLADRAGVPLRNNKARLAQVVQSVNYVKLHSRHPQAGAVTSRNNTAPVPERLQDHLTRKELATENPPPTSEARSK